MPRIIASVEARMGSSRLPGKMLMDVAGRPAIGRLTDRLRRAESLDGIVLATTDAAADDALADWADEEGIPCYRGSEEDVLSRVVEAQRSQKSDIVVEVTGDCTLIDPDLIDLGVDTYLANSADVVTNVNRLSFPMGMDIQVFSLSLLETVEAEIVDPVVREHVSIHFYRNPDKYRLHHILAPRPWRRPDLRLQLDYREDLEFITEVYRRLEPDFGDRFGIAEIIALLRRTPSLETINKHCRETVVP